MSKFGLNLRKWKSNSIEFLEQIDPTIQSNSVEHTFESPCKTLGVLWHPDQDYFHFKLQINENSTLTKRIILSETAKIFDPLGWLAPCTIKAKILIQTLWLLPIGWDDTVPSHIENDWVKFKNQLNQCANIKIPRWLGYSESNQDVTLVTQGEVTKTKS